MDAINAAQLLIEEYPSFKNRNIKIAKQFIATDGRISNTFLIESDLKGFDTFIAKSFVHHPESLKSEWIVLKLLQEKNAPAPRLLIPEHEPVYFILMEYVDGIPASEAIKRGHNINDIFRKMGETTGKANSIELNTYGDIVHPSDISWKVYFMERLTAKLPLIRSVLGEEIFTSVMKLIDDRKYILDSESEGKPMLVHHDIYLENFLLEKETGELILIDYGIVFGGRPLFDLAKFYIWDLSKYPEQKDTFLKAYSRYVQLPSNFTDVMTFYVIRECFGMIDFFNKIGDLKMRNEAVSVLTDIINKKGVITDIINP